MSKKKRQESVELGRKAARISVFLLCLGGFSYHTMQFLFMYWDYPTVIDIQETSPSNPEVPAITICNPIGYNYTELCSTHFGDYVCKNVNSFRGGAEEYCKNNKDVCLKVFGVTEDLIHIEFKQFLRHLKYISYEDHEKLRIKLEDYMNCNIELDGSTRSCNMQNVMGSFYTKNHMPQYCYTIYSLWGQPDKKRDRIPKRSTMKLHFFLNASERADTLPLRYGVWFPLHSTPTTPFVQIAVHSPYFLPSPYLTGSSYQGGHSYELRLTMSEKHLLPLPYQTKCTDYLKAWARNGGRGPINQLECRAKKYSEIVGCVPVSVDYPHTFRICNESVSDNLNMTTSEIECSMHVEHFNQPCDSTSYLTTQEEKLILVNTTDSLEKKRMLGRDCSKRKIWNPECSTIDIEILFNTFEIKNITYNPKIESIELFSVIGGYMGMWLGISLVTVYDFIGSVLGYIKAWGYEKQKKKIRTKKNSLLAVSKFRRGKPTRLYTKS